MARDLDVYLLGQRVGRLRQEDSGRLSFAYSRAWLETSGARALSLSLPLQQEAFADRQTRPFFAGLLPDELARERLARHLGVSRRNDFALLAEVGGECAGAVALFSPEQRPPGVEEDGLVELDESTLASYLRDLPKRPLLAGGELRLSLAGAQDKMALVRRADGFFMPRGDQPTTHIVKPAIASFAHTVGNEFFCLRLAERVGLAVPAALMGLAEDIEYLLIERYDRELREGQAVRLHQEDFCQALAIAPEQKYESEGGPSLARCFELLGACRRPAVERLELLRRVIFNFLIGNADAHGKNFALLYGDRGVTLAPVYDVLSTAAYPEHTDRMAMKIGGKKRFAAVLPRHWKTFAEQTGLAWRRVARDLTAMAAVVPEQARRLAGELEDSDPYPDRHPDRRAFIDRIVDGIDSRSAALEI